MRSLPVAVMVLPLAGLLAACGEDEERFVPLAVLRARNQFQRSVVTVGAGRGRLRTGRAEVVETLAGHPG